MSYIAGIYYKMDTHHGEWSVSDYDSLHMYKEWKYLIANALEIVLRDMRKLAQSMERNMKKQYQVAANRFNLEVELV